MTDMFNSAQRLHMFGRKIVPQNFLLFVLTKMRKLKKKYKHFFHFFFWSGNVVLRAKKKKSLFLSLYELNAITKIQASIFFLPI